MAKIKTALVSVSDKSNLEQLAQFFKLNDVHVLSTGGTYKALKALGVEVQAVSEHTGFPEVMDGRVKTLHPKIHMGLLARQGVAEDEAKLKEHGVPFIDLLVVNLYPFKAKRKENLPEKELVEFVDVGGPSMIRAGAKNFNRLTVLTDPSDYGLLANGDYKESHLRKELAGKAFKHLSLYDEQIYKWMLGEESVSLRYGENPHQKASWDYNASESGLHQAEKLQGKELSFNNLVDLTAAVETLSVVSRGESRPCVISVKHNNPCGVGLGSNVEEAVKNSLAADPKSVFGGIVALNQSVNAASAEALSKIFLECVIAPDFSVEAMGVLSAKKNLRLLKWPKLKEGFFPKEDFKRVSGGQVVQGADSVDFDFSQWQQVSGESPSDEVKQALELSWKVVSRLKSNAIALASGTQSLGLGMGQVNRVDAVKQAISRWKEFHGDFSGPLVLASDAFFPFPDSVEWAASQGVKWVVQPGGSIKDELVIAKAKELGVGLFLTGKRHFLH